MRSETPESPETKSEQPENNDQALNPPTGDGLTTDSELYHRFANKIRGLVRSQLSRSVARRVDAEDIVQSVFRRYFTAVSQRRYDLPQESDLWNLLVTITLNRLRSVERFHRAAKRNIHRTTNNDELADVPAPGADDANYLELAVSEVLELLPESHREIVLLRLENWSVVEIANRVGRSKRTVERILQHVRELLNAKITSEP